ncbi:MAG: aromatic aminobenezylarsenical efflux permease ArsG family transporter [Prevotella sp.]|nr:aromatic aminobenezylarsenical efflux permease ArsG family transporter [Prevotella sp.]MDY6130140.1 aromatic aminobenezylarsenical efflux permease ArsG family transporter [Prevotella sp.]
MELIKSLFENGQFPSITAFLLGLLVAIHPCPMATNIAAMGYITKEADSSKKVLHKGLIYTLGRVAGYSLLGIILILIIKSGVQLMNFGDEMSKWGERFLSPLLIAIGLYLLYTDLLHHHDHVPSTSDSKGHYRGMKGSFALGVAFSLAFCPESGIVYFGMIIPMSVDSSVGYLLPVSFAIGTGLPVAIMAWAIAHSLQSYNKMNLYMHIFQIWITRIVAVIFILAGIFCFFY